MLGVSPTCRNDDVALKFGEPAGEVGCRRLIPACIQPAGILGAGRAARLVIQQAQLFIIALFPRRHVCTSVLSLMLLSDISAAAAAAPLQAQAAVCQGPADLEQIQRLQHQTSLCVMTSSTFRI